MIKSQQEKAEIFHSLHNNGKLLVLPNIWEPLGAALLEDIGYTAIATASASVALTNGFPDGENIPFKDLLVLLKKITSAVNIPVTADVESGYADNNVQLSENIKRLVDSGIVGINIEDTNKKSKKLYSIEEQCERIRLIKNVSKTAGVSLFINARTDIFLHAAEFNSEEAKMNAVIERGKAYREAGGDCFFPVLLIQENNIKTLLSQLGNPVNIIAFKGIPPLSRLNEMGVARISLGPGILKLAIKKIKETAEKLINYEGLDEVTENDITSDYLKSLVQNKK